MPQQSNILHGEGELIPDLNISVGQLLLMQLTTHSTRVSQVSLIDLSFYGLHFSLYTIHLKFVIRGFLRRSLITNLNLKIEIHELKMADSI